MIITYGRLYSQPSNQNDGVKYFVVDIKKEIIQCYNKFENKKQKDGFYEYYNKIKWINH